MKEWIVERDGNPTTVTVDGGDDTLQCRAGNRRHRIVLLDSTPTTLTLFFDGHRVVHADIQWDGDTCHLIVNHVPYTFVVRPAPCVLRQPAIPSGSLLLRTTHDTRRTTEVRAPMPARVVAVHVKPGATVTAGQSIVVVEAMKMQNELTAPTAGTIGAVHVQSGDAVEAHQRLVTITGARVAPSTSTSLPGKNFLPGSDVDVVSPSPPRVRRS